MDPSVVASPTSAIVMMVARPPGTDMLFSSGMEAPNAGRYGIALANSEMNGSITATTIMLIKTS